MKHLIIILSIVTSVFSQTLPNFRLVSARDWADDNLDGVVQTWELIDSGKTNFELGEGVFVILPNSVGFPTTYILNLFGKEGFMYKTRFNLFQDGIVVRLSDYNLGKGEYRIEVKEEGSRVGRGSLFSVGFWKISSLSFSTGETSLTKGITGTVVLSNKDERIILDINRDLGEVIHTINFEWLNPGYSFGFYKSEKATFWFGPYIEIEITDWLNFLTWEGWSFGDPETLHPSYPLKWMFTYNQLTINYQNQIFYYALLHYQNNLPEHLFGMNYSEELINSFYLNLGLGFMFRAQKPLWNFGVSYQF